jgi:hypothetical protein
VTRRVVGDVFVVVAVRLHLINGLPAVIFNPDCKASNAIFFAHEFMVSQIPKGK